MSIFHHHSKLFFFAGLLFVILTIGVAISPAVSNQINNAPLPGFEPLSESEARGKLVYINNGCVACHTQQVRNVEIDKPWGSRPNVAADYAGISRTNFWVNTATLMGTERTGPDLTNIGKRQPSEDWHLVHLYNPRAVIQESIMPPYPWLFEVKDSIEKGDKEIQVPSEYRKYIKGYIVATQDAMDLVAYLKSLQQIDLPDGTQPVEFLYEKEVIAESSSNGENGNKQYGQELYTTYCSSCHQTNGQGLSGAFPPLAGSKIVQDDDPSIMVEIIINGYDARDDYGVMPAIGTINDLDAKKVTAIMNHERSSWGNNGREISEDEVIKIMEALQKESLNNPIQ